MSEVVLPQLWASPPPWLPLPPHPRSLHDPLAPSAHSHPFRFSNMKVSTGATKSTVASRHNKGMYRRVLNPLQPLVLQFDIRPRPVALQNPQVRLILPEIMNTMKTTFRNARLLMR